MFGDNAKCPHRRSSQENVLLIPSLDAVNLIVLDSASVPIVLRSKGQTSKVNVTERYEPRFSTNASYNCFVQCCSAVALSCSFAVVAVITTTDQRLLTKGRIAGALWG